MIILNRIDPANEGSTAEFQHGRCEAGKKKFKQMDGEINNLIIRCLR
jgi:hypothetical protein